MPEIKVFCGNAKMTEFRTFAAIILVLLAAYIMIMNWVCLVVNIQNQRRGIDRHTSMIPLLTIVISIGAYFCAPGSNPFWVFIVPLLDISSWCLFWLPFFLFLTFIKKKRN